MEREILKKAAARFAKESRFKEHRGQYGSRRLQRQLKHEDIGLAGTKCTV